MTTNTAFWSAARGAIMGAIISFLLISFEISRSGQSFSLETLNSILGQQPLYWVVLLFPILIGAITLITRVNIQRIRNRGTFYEALFDNSPIAIVTLDEQHKIVTCNPAFESLFGYSKETVIGRNLDELITNDDLREGAELISKKVVEGNTFSAEVTRQRKDGTLVQVELSAVPVVLQGESIGAFGLYQDISAKYEAEKALRESEEKFRDIFENVTDFLYWHDLEGNLTDVNPAFSRVSGYSKEELLSMSIEDLMPEEHKRFFPYYLSKVTKQGTGRGLLTVVTKSGEEIIVEYKNSLIQSEDGPKSIRGSAHDITERKSLEMELRSTLTELDELARTDPLTKLFNRRGIYEYLRARIENNLTTGESLSIALVDLDNLKKINDRYGHSQGDQALLAVAKTLKGGIRGYDRVGRHGGDEFLLILQDTELDGAVKTCKRLASSLSSEKTTHEDLSYSISIGVVNLPKEELDSADIDQLLKKADDALYITKSKGGGHVEASAWLAAIF